MVNQEVKLRSFAGTWKVLYRMPRTKIILPHLRGKWAVMLMSTGRVEYVTKAEIT